MADIIATNPVVVPAEGSVTYNKWYLTKLIGDINPNKAQLSITLNRAALKGDNMLLMDGKGSKSSFTLDIWKEMSETPEIATAIQAVLTAVVAYATKKNLL